MKPFYLLFFSMFTLAISAQNCIDTIVIGYDNVMEMTDNQISGWGDNTYGQLGINSTERTLTPTAPLNNGDWENISIGRTHTVGLKTDGSLWAWGYNLIGQVGDDSTTDRLVPTQIGTDTDWTSISAGNLHSLALKSDGTLWGWGNNQAHELGQPASFAFATTPIEISSDPHWQAVFAGYFRSYAIKDDGTLWAWGKSTDGSLGNGQTNGFFSDMVQIGTDTDWAMVSCNHRNATFGIKTDGSLWAWGDNTYGQLGINNTSNQNLPVQVGTDTWLTVGAGSFDTVGIKSDGTLWAWGTVFGDGTIVTESVTPVQLGTDADWTSLSKGRLCVFAQKTDQTVWAWGHSYSGEFMNENNLTYNSLTMIFECNDDLSVDDISLEQSFSVHPNPFNEELHIKLPQRFDNHTIDIAILNILGQTVYQTQEQYDGQTMTINGISSTLNSGVYFIQIHSDEASLTKKLIKKQ